jgi:hypothetical protein
MTKPDQYGECVNDGAATRIPPSLSWLTHLDLVRVKAGMYCEDLDKKRRWLPVR